MKNILRLISWTVIVIIMSGCFHAKKKDETVLSASYLTPKIIYSSKWQQFTVKHPSGFWQVITKEKWTLLYNNQDAPAQMIIDSKRNIFFTPKPEGHLNRFLKSLKAKNITIINEGTAMVEGVEARKITYTATILFDYWDKFEVTRKITVLSFVRHKHSYIIAYLADETSYDTYINDFETLVTNFSLKSTQNIKPKPERPLGTKPPGGAENPY